MCLTSKHLHPRRAMSNTLLNLTPRTSTPSSTLPEPFLQHYEQPCEDQRPQWRGALAERTISYTWMQRREASFPMSTENNVAGCPDRWENTQNTGTVCEKSRTYGTMESWDNIASGPHKQKPDNDAAAKTRAILEKEWYLEQTTARTSNTTPSRQHPDLVPAHTRSHGM